MCLPTALKIRKGYVDISIYDNHYTLHPTSKRSCDCTRCWTWSKTTGVLCRTTCCTHVVCIDPRVLYRFTCPVYIFCKRILYTYSVRLACSVHVCCTDRRVLLKTSLLWRIYACWNERHSLNSSVLLLRRRDYFMVLARKCIYWSREIVLHYI